LKRRLKNFETTADDTPVVPVLFVRVENEEITTELPVPFEVDFAPSLDVL
jgi:hypothetical protein